MFTEEEIVILNQVRDIEDQQRLTMKTINSIYATIKDLSIEGEDQNPELRNASNNMKMLIDARISLLRSIGIEPTSPLPDNIDEHYLTTLTNNTEMI